MTTHEVLQDTIRNMEEMLRVIDAVVKVYKADPGISEVFPHRKVWQTSLDVAKEKEKEIRPSIAQKMWEKGQKEASKNYNPPASKPTG